MAKLNVRKKNGFSCDNKRGIACKSRSLVYEKTEMTRTIDEEMFATNWLCLVRNSN